MWLDAWSFIDGKVKKWQKKSALLSLFFQKEVLPHELLFTSRTRASCTNTHTHSSSFPGVAVLTKLAGVTTRLAARNVSATIRRREREREGTARGVVWGCGRRGKKEKKRKATTERRKKTKNGLEHEGDAAGDTALSSEDGG